MTDFAETDSDIPREIGGSASGYALSGRIMLSAIIILFFVVVLMVVLHLYARWYLLRARRRRFLRRNRHNRRTHLVFYVDPAATSAAASQGLDASVLKTLPLFKYSSGEPLECAVCLSEFEENETGRRLPKCSHSFHIDCIDMWFQSHNTCPLCRSPVEPVQGSEDQAQSAATEQESSGPAVCSTCHHDESRDGNAGPSGVSSGGRRKPSEIFSVSIEVPRRGDLEADLSSDSPATQFRSPVSRMLSFTRILSRERRGNVSPSTANCGGSEADLERGREENQPSQG